MGVLLGVQININHFYEIKRKIDNILADNKLTLTNKYKLDMLRRELLNYLSDILSLRCEDVLSTSFYMQVNSVESKVLSLLNQKEQELTELEKSKKEALNIVKKIVSLIYSIDVLQNSIHIRVNSDNILLDLKTKVEKIVKDSKRVYAVEYMLSKLDVYKKGLIELIDLVLLYRKKDQIPLDRKQDILDIFNSISLQTQYAKNRKSIFSKDDIYNKDENMHSNISIEYIKEYEDRFIECCNYIGIKLNTFYDRIKDLIYTEDVSRTHIINCIEFVYKKYYKSINREYEKINDENKVLYKKIRDDLVNLYTYDGITVLENLLDNINNTKTLPSYLQDNRFKEYIENILFDFDVSIKDDIEIYNILDELNDIILTKFNFNKYLELFEFNTLKVRQISEFRQYYIRLLEEAKEELIKNYVISLEETLSKNISYIYKTQDENIKINKKMEQIKLLKEALNYINENYRKFDKQNLKIYIDSLEQKYSLNNLYKNVIKKKSNLTNYIKLKSIILKENMYISEFIEKEDITKNLSDNILDNIISDDSLKNEIIELLNLKTEEKDYNLKSKGLGKYVINKKNKI